MSKDQVTQTTETDFERGAKFMRASIVARIERDDMPSTWKFQAADIAKATPIPNEAHDDRQF